jgi:hypothetical protein
MLEIATSMATRPKDVRARFIKPLSSPELEAIRWPSAK